MPNVEKKRRSLLSPLGVLLCVVVLAGWYMGPALHLPSLVASIAAAVVTLCIAVVLMTRRERQERQQFDRLPLRRSDQLAVGDHVRVRVVVQEPATLKAPIQSTACVYYRAAALVTNIDPYDPEPEEIAVTYEGQLANARDSAGTLLLDFRAAVELVGSTRLPGARYEEPRAHDPLKVGVAEPYRIDLQLVSPGLELEAAGVVELVDGVPTLRGAGGPLQLGRVGGE